MRLDGVRVLLVDDYPVVPEVITRLLGEYGARVTAVPGVPEALEALRREQPNVVLADIEMPGGDGYALIRKVRASPKDRGGQKPVNARLLVDVVTTLAAPALHGFS